MERKTVVICGSLKPSKDNESRSATRGIANIILRGMEDSNNRNFTYFDLLDMDLPFYDGRYIEEYDSTTLEEFKKEILQSDNIICTVPCYWNSAAGGFVNLLNLLGGPKYDYPDERNILENKHVHIVTIGATIEDAVIGGTHVRNMFSALGALVMPKEINIGNLRNSSESERKKITYDLYQQGKNLNTKFGMGV